MALVDVGSAGQAVIQVLKIAVRLSFVVGVITAFGGILFLAISTVGVVLNGGVVADLMALVQMWLPFNLAPVLSWLLTGALLVISYRFTVVAIYFLNSFLNE